MFYRRLVSLVALLASALLLAGCAGADGRRAQELLEQAEQAQEELESMSFAVRVWTSSDGPSLSASLRGGGYLKGGHAGDFFMEASVEGLPVPGGFTVLRRGGEMFLEAGGQWTEVAVPPPTGAAAEAEAALAAFDFAHYVTDVSVAEGVDLDGEPVAKIVGVIDTAALVGDLLDELGGLAQASGAGPLGDLSEHLGKTRAVLYVSEESHLVVRALVDLPVRAEGEKVELHLDYALTGVDKPVSMPGPPSAA